MKINNKFYNIIFFTFFNDSRQLVNFNQSWKDKKRKNPFEDASDPIRKLRKDSVRIVDFIVKKCIIPENLFEKN